MILTHGALIQEWEHFLYDIFAEGVIYYLSLGNPKYQLRLKDLQPTIRVRDIRTHISEEIKKSIRGLKPLLSESNKLFEPEVPDHLKEEMKKQTQIRHIFQHNKGEIRRKDLSEIGSNGPDACFEILGDGGKLEQYKEGQKILLSLPEIQKLYTVIEEYSEAFQKQAEKT